MIIEGPVLDLLEFEILSPSGGFVLGRSQLGVDSFGDRDETLQWAPYLGSATQCSFQRGGKRAGIVNSMDVGLLSITLVNAGDPSDEPDLVPGTPCRVLLHLDDDELPDAQLFTGQISDIDMNSELDKQRNTIRNYVTIQAADGVQQHANTTRYGAIAPDGYERWESRIARLALSSVAPIEVPPIDEPIVRYAL